MKIKWGENDDIIIKNEEGRREEGEKNTEKTE